MREHTLNKCGTQALIVSPKPTVVVERASCLGEGSPKAVLVVHDRSKRLHGMMFSPPAGTDIRRRKMRTSHAYHEKQDLQDHGRGTAQAASEGALQRTSQVKLRDRDTDTQG